MIKNIYESICDMIWGPVPQPEDTRFYYLCLLKNEVYDENEYSIHGLWPQNSKTDFHLMGDIFYNVGKHFRHCKHFSQKHIRECEHNALHL